MKKYRSVKALAEVLNAGTEEKTFTESALRNYVRDGDENGLAQYVKRVGTKILLNEEDFIKWIESK